jgi:hypothetical protein
LLLATARTPKSQSTNSEPLMTGALNAVEVRHSAFWLPAPSMVESVISKGPDANTSLTPLPKA